MHFFLTHLPLKHRSKPGFRLIKQNNIGKTQRKYHAKAQFKSQIMPNAFEKKKAFIIYWEETEY